MSANNPWYDHPCCGRVSEPQTEEGRGPAVNLLSYFGEARASFKEIFGESSSETAPLDKVLSMWPERGELKKEWLRKVVEGGPVEDRMRVMSKIVSQLPMLSLFYLDHLISLVNVSKKRFAITSTELLTNLFDKFLLPNGRPLLNMKDRPLASLDNINTEKAQRKQKSGIPARQKILTFWYFEEQLKTRYIRFIKAMEEMLKIETDKVNKLKLINIFSILCNKKESQSLIVEILVNKLGDNCKKVIGCVLSKLVDLEKNHPSLVPIIVRIIRKFIFRPNLSIAAQYYSMQLLARTKFNSNRLETAPIDINDEDDSNITSLPVEVIQIYIGVLKRLMESSKTKCEKLYSAIMCGISRAIPYAKGAEVMKYTNSIFKLVHSSNLNLSIQGLKVLFAIVSKQESGAEDSQKTFDRYQKLVYRTLANPSVFFNSKKTKLVEVFFKSVAIDNDILRVKTMIKRLLQLCIQIGDAGFICVCLIFLSRLIKSKHNPIFVMKSKQQKLTNGEFKVPKLSDDTVKSVMKYSEDSDDEIMADIISDDEDTPESPKLNTKVDHPVSSWVHTDNIKLNDKSVHYDPFILDPKFSNVDKDELLELHILRNHSHPTVKLFVEKILKSEVIDYKSDPCEDFSLSKFLDRFAFRNPKDIKDKRKLMPGSTKITTDPARNVAVNTKQFADLNKGSIPIDELFFHNYFNHAKKTKKVAVDEEDEEFNDSDTDFDALLDEVEKDSDDDISLDDSDMEDFGDDDFEDEMSEGGSINEMMDDDNEDVSMEDDDVKNASMSEDEDEASEDLNEPTIHSSKRKKIGEELSSITTGAMAVGNDFAKVQRNFETKRKHDRKVRKGKKPKKAKKEGISMKSKKIGKKHSKK